MKKFKLSNCCSNSIRT